MSMPNLMCTFEGCGRLVKGHGLCNGHNEQRRAGRQLTPLRTRVDGTADARFAAYVEERGECHIWTGPLTRWGYGVVSVDGVGRLAHQYAYEAEHGPVSRDQVLDHACHTPACVRVDHLRAVSPRENSENRRGAQANSKSGIRGVCFVPGRGWLAQAGRGAGAFAGYHATAEEAADAARARRNERFTNNLADRGEQA